MVRPIDRRLLIAMFGAASLAAVLIKLSEDGHPSVHHLALRAEMRGEARGMVGGHTMNDYAFEPIQQLRENMRN